jgi:hypothetical protein
MSEGIKMQKKEQTSQRINTLTDLAKLANYSFMSTLNSDPDATTDGIDHSPREVFRGHYVPVKPTPIDIPVYITHSKSFF